MNLMFFRTGPQYDRISGRHVTLYRYFFQKWVKKVPFSYRHRRTWPRLMK